MKSKIQIGFLMFCSVLVLSALVQAVSFPLIDLQTQVNSGWAMTVRAGQKVSWPYVYGIIDDAVILQIDKIFDRPFSQDGFNYPIIIEFEKLSADATSKIIIRDEYIENETGSEWFDYHMHLMVDASNPEAGFDPRFVPDGDQLEDVSFALSYGYNGLPIRLNFMDTDGSGVQSSPPAESGENVFWPGHNGGQIVIVTNPQMQVGEHFGLKEIPTIPEPATVLLLGIGGLITLTRRGKSI